MSYRVNFRQLLLVQSSKVSMRGQAANQSGLLLVLDLWSLNHRYRVRRGLLLIFLRDFRKVKSRSQDRLFAWRSHWKWLGGYCTASWVGWCLTRVGRQCCSWVMLNKFLPVWFKIVKAMAKKSVGRVRAIKALLILMMISFGHVPNI